MTSSSESRRFLLILVVLALPWLTIGCGPGSQSDDVVVFAAASLRDVLEEIAEAFETAQGSPVSFNFAASNVLARQIEAAPRCDVYLSASEEWMDHIESVDRLADGTRRTFLSNRLVAIVHQKSELPIRSPEDLARVEYRHLSIADPDAVPAGRYARQYLEALPWEDGTLWDVVKARVVPGANARAALALVEADRNLVGIVYRTDAAASERVRVVFEAEPAAAPEIRYAAARVESERDPAGALAFLAFLESPEGKAIFEKHGFMTAIE